MLCLLRLPHLSVNMDMNQKYRIYLILMTALTAALLGFWIFCSEQLREQQREGLLQRITLSLAERLSDRIHNSTIALYGIGELALQQDGYIEGLPSLIQNIRASNTSILNVAIMPDGVVQQIEPLTYNADAIGHNMFLDPLRVKDAELARDSRQLTVTGPYNLIQGGQGVIARLPLYEQGRFWGFVSIVYQFPKLVESLLERYQDFDILFQVQTDAQTPAILSNTERLPAQHAQARIDLPNNQWLVKLAYHPTFNWILTLKLAGAALALLLATYFYHRILTAIASQRYLRRTLDHNVQLKARQSAYRQLLAQISHDLRSPMQHILNEVRQIGSGDAGKQAPQQTIELNVRYQLALVDQLLDYATHQDREQSLHPEPGYTYHFLQQLSEQAKSLADAQGNRLQLNLAPDLPTIIQADFNQLQRVLINLLSNAAKFTRQGTITLSVGKLPSEKARHHRLRFRVQDDGPGMPDMRTQGQHANSGHGLGFMIISELLRQMGSHLEYQPNLDGGADFHFDLDLQLPAEAPEPYLERHTLDWDGEGLNILLVDPNPASAEGIAELLLGYGVDVLTSADLQEARQILRQATFDLVITEMDLPDGNGWDLLKAVVICSTPAPVMLYASRPAQPGHQFCFAAELLRPAGSDQLLALIRQLTSTDLQQQSLAASS